MAKIPNPYIPGPSIDKDTDFYGRQDIFRFVRDTFSSSPQNVVVLHGQRRIGKSSILLQLKKPANLSSGFHPVYFDLQGWAGCRLDEVLYGLAEEIAQTLEIPVIEHADLRADTGCFRDRFLPQVYEALSGRRLLLLLDEFDVLDEEGMSSPDIAIETFLPYLQKSIMTEEKIALVFVIGRRLEELDHLGAIKSARYKEIWLLSEADARMLITEPVSGAVEYDGKAVDHIISLTACHPYLTQLVCYELISYLNMLDKATVTVVDVDAVIDGALESGSTGLAWMWDGLPLAERFILSAVAHVTDQRAIATKQRIRSVLEKHQVRLHGIELTRAPEQLLKLKWLEQSAGGYRFIVRLLRRWIVAKHSLESAKRELEDISKRAIVRYEYARGAHLAGHLEEAIEGYRRALRANVNHAAARLGLAQAFYEQGELREAVSEYEKAYELDDKARDGLVEAAYELGSELLEEDWEEALKLFKLVHTLDPDHGDLAVKFQETARQKKLAALYERGARYLEQRDWLKAIEELEKVALSEE
jgi:hypothetical protein